MALISYQDIKFARIDDGKVRADFLKVFYFEIDLADLDKIGDFEIQDGNIFFPDIEQDSADKSFNKIISRSFGSLKSKLTKSPATYIHRNSGIPLIGSLTFGIVDKGTDMVEIKPLTGCNINCIFCSVDEGIKTKKLHDFIIEKDYLIQEVKKLLDFKKSRVKVFINPHGEPLLYADIVDLVKSLSTLKYVDSISIITNGTLLTESLANDMINAGLKEINLSINSLDNNRAKEIADCAYDSKRITETILKIKDRLKITLTPVYMKGINGKDIEELIKFAKDNGLSIMIQNYMQNRKGRKPVKEIPMDEFFELLKNWQDKYQIPLLMQGTIHKTEELPKPFKKGDVIDAEAICRGRYGDETIAVSKERIVTVKKPFSQKKSIKVKVTKDRYNIFYGI